MYHNYLLVQKIQKIKQNTILNIYFASSQYINWTYETKRKPTESINNPIFPIVIRDNGINIEKKQKGNETSCYNINPTKIRFLDDYSVPEGFLICVTGPEGYMPSLVKFKQKPSINLSGYNLSGYNNTIPCQFEVLLNETTRQASVLMHTNQRVFYGVCIDFDKKDGDFKAIRKPSRYDPFDLTISLIDGKIENVSLSQVKNVLPDVPEDKLDKLVKSLNELADFLKNSDFAENYCSEIPKDLKNKILNLFSEIISTGSAAVTIADSYINNGVVGQLIKTIIDYIV